MMYACVYIHMTHGCVVSTYLKILADWQGWIILIKAAKPRCHQWNLQNLKSHRWTFLAIQSEEIPPERCTPPHVAELAWYFQCMFQRADDQDVEPKQFHREALETMLCPCITCWNWWSNFSDFWTTHSSNKITIKFFTIKSMVSLDGGGVKMQLQGYVLLFPRVICSIHAQICSGHCWLLRGGTFLKYRHRLYFSKCM